MHTFKLYIVLIVLFSCGNDNGARTLYEISDHIKYFGFTLIDTYWDDPSDSETKTNYADEVHTFCNLADLLVVDATNDIQQRVQNFNSLNMKAILHLNELFFEFVDAESPSGSNYDLRSDFKNRWNIFKTINQSVLNERHIGAFYIGEEPTWNGITFEELETVINLVKSEFALIPVMIIEAYPALSDLRIPVNVDWIGFDHYFIKNPNTDATFQKEWQLLLTKRSSNMQKIMVIMDSHYIKEAHTDFGNIQLREMGVVANNYYELAKKDTNVVGILGYFWPNGFDNSQSLGARGMPQDIVDQYIKIGKTITGK